MKHQKDLFLADIQTKSTTSKYLYFLLQCVLGSIFLGILSQFSVKLSGSPIPITLQTFGLYLLLLSIGKNGAICSVVVYLAQATAGLPVLAGGVANPFWMAGPTCGFLLGFLAFAFIAGSILEMKSTPSLLRTFLALFLGTVALNTCGYLHVTFVLGISNALQLVIEPLIPGSLLKVVSATCLSKPIFTVKNLLNNWKSK